MARSDEMGTGFWTWTNGWRDRRTEGRTDGGIITFCVIFLLAFLVLCVCVCVLFAFGLFVCCCLQLLLLKLTSGTHAHTHMQTHTHMHVLMANIDVYSVRPKSSLIERAANHESREAFSVNNAMKI